MRPNIVVLIGVSGSGKTTLINAVANALPTVDKVKSLTTRMRRGPKDDETYDFVSFLEFFLLWLCGRIVQYDHFNWNLYGNTRRQFTEIKPNHVGILAMTEAGAEALKRMSFTVRTVKIIPIGAPIRKGREGADRVRVERVRTDTTIENSFAEGGLENAIGELVRYVDWQFE